MLTLTPELIMKLGYTGMPRDKATVWAQKLGAACKTAHIDTAQRLAHFLAQATHESGSFYYLEEIWGPSPAQIRYEGRLDLGNTQAGDGKRYMGRGVFMLTGRANYRDTGQRIGYPLEAHPELASQIGVGSLIACDYWTTHGLNTLADRGGLLTVRIITRVINGGLNGLPDRERRYLLAARALGL